MRFQPSPSPEPMAPACRRRNASRPGGDGEIEGEAGAFTLDASATDFASEVFDDSSDDVESKTGGPFASSRFRGPTLKLFEDLVDLSLGNPRAGVLDFKACGFAGP